MVPNADETCFVPGDVTWNDAGQNLVIFHSVHGSYHALNASGSEIWRTLAAGRSASGIADRLARRFGGDREIITADVREFLDQARDSGLIVEAG